MNGAQSTEPLDVLIVGAGPTGLMLAHLLALQGRKVRLVEANGGRAKESRALAVQARSLELFQSLGLVDRVLEQGIAARGVSVFRDGRRRVHLDFSGIGRDDTPFPYVFTLSQAGTEEILEKSLESQGVVVERRTVFTGFEQGPAKVAAHLRREDGNVEIIEAKFLVGCDGARSQVRKSCGLTFEGGTYERDFMLADVKVVWDLPRDRVQFFLAKDSLAVVLPLKGSAHSRVIHVGRNPRGLKEAAENLTTKMPLGLEEMQREFVRAAGREARLEEPLWLTRYRVHHRCVERLRQGRVFLAGDAAHIHSPAGGQGMNTGLQDAANLAWKLAAVLSGRAGDEILDTYQSERWPVAQKLLHFTDRLFSAITSFNPLLRWTLGAVLPVFGRMISAGFQPRFLFNFVSQLNIRYHPSAVVGESLHIPREGALAKAGRRAPDAPLTEGGTLFDLLRGYRFHVLVMSAAPVPEGARGEFERTWRRRTGPDAEAPIHWIDSRRSPVALERYDVRDVLVSVVRPDGYIGYQTDILE